jgi:hypothetical protein
MLSLIAQARCMNVNNSKGKGIVSQMLQGKTVDHGLKTSSKLFSRLL